MAERVQRGIKLLDEVTPGWFNPINPDTLKISDRESCIFAQANHDFKKGIVQVADAAVKKGVKGVRLLKGQDLQAISGVNNYKAERVESALKGTVVDVFYYGFDVDMELKRIAETGGGQIEEETYNWGNKKTTTTKRETYARRHAWDELDRQWREVVIQKKASQAR